MRVGSVLSEFGYVTIAHEFHRPPDEVREEWSHAAYEDAEIYLAAVVAHGKAAGRGDLHGKGAPALE